MPRASRRPAHSLAALAFSALAVVGIVTALPAGATVVALPKQVWGVAIVREAASDPGWKRVGTLRANGINAIIANGSALGTEKLDSPPDGREKKRLLVVAGHKPKATCGACLPTAYSPAAAVRMTRDKVSLLVRLNRPRQIHFLRGSRRAARSPLSSSAAAPPSTAKHGAGRSRWPAPSDVSTSSSLRCASTTARLTAYLKLLRERIPVSTDPGGGGGGGGGGGAGGGPDTHAPTMPGKLAVSATTSTTVTLTWSASTDDKGVASYGVYRSGSRVATPTATTQTLVGLTCATTYPLAVSAADAAGNRSAKTSLNATTAACTQLPPSNGTANLWVDPNGGSCTRAATAGTGSTPRRAAR